MNFMFFVRLSFLLSLVNGQFLVLWSGNVTTLNTPYYWTPGGIFVFTGGGGALKGNNHLQANFQGNIANLTGPTIYPAGMFFYLFSNSPSIIIQIGDGASLYPPIPLSLMSSKVIYKIRIKILSWDK